MECYFCASELVDIDLTVNCVNQLCHAKYCSLACQKYHQDEHSHSLETTSRYPEKANYYDVLERFYPNRIQYEMDMLQSLSLAKGDSDACTLAYNCGYDIQSIDTFPHVKHLMEALVACGEDTNEHLFMFFGRLGEHRLIKDFKMIHTYRFTSAIPDRWKRSHFIARITVACGVSQRSFIPPILSSFQSSHMFTTQGPDTLLSHSPATATTASNTATATATITESSLQQVCEINIHVFLFLFNSII
jgi:hypothetical protein